jgi:hypothetical protein
MCCHPNGTAARNKTKNRLSSFGNTCCDFEMSTVVPTLLFEQVVIQIGNSYTSKHHLSRAEYSIGANKSEEKIMAFGMSSI